MERELVDASPSGTDGAGHAELVVAYLRERVPSLPADLVDRLDEPLDAVLTHGELQALVMAATVAAPHLSREPFETGATGLDLVAWLGPVLDGQEPRRGAVDRPPRGSYRSPNVTMRPIQETDIGRLYSASLAPTTAHRWRFRGHTPSPEEFRRSLFGGSTLAQFMVVPTSGTTEPAGLVSAYSGDLTSKHCYVAFQRTMSGSGGPETRGLMIEGFLVFVQFLFDHFDLRKVYIELPEYNLDLIGNGGDPFVIEGELKDHYYFGDRMWSQFILALYRERWEELAPGFRGHWPEGHFDHRSPVS